MFKGSHNVNVDAKGRIAIPARLREQLTEMCEGDMVVTADPIERCLLLYPRQNWDELEAALVAIRNGGSAVRWVERHLIGHATDIQLDPNGRLLLNPSLREFASLEKKAILVGATTKVELWSESVWQASLDAMRKPDAPALAQTQDLIESLPI